MNRTAAQLRKIASKERFIKNPTSWDDVERCDCHACKGMAEIRRRCLSTGEPLAVWDCRMFGMGFRITDTELIFIGPATHGAEHATHEAAAREVLKTQKHCDAFLSTWPLKPRGWSDYLWRVITIA